MLLGIIEHIWNRVSTPRKKRRRRMTQPLDLLDEVIARYEQLKRQAQADLKQAMAKAAESGESRESPKPEESKSTE